MILAFYIAVRKTVLMRILILTRDETEIHPLQVLKGSFAIREHILRDLWVAAVCVFLQRTVRAGRRDWTVKV